MRCVCCNRNLSKIESTLKHPTTGEYLDICRKCLKDIPIVPVEGQCKEDEIYEDEDAFVFEEEDLDESY